MEEAKTPQTPETPFIKLVKGVSKIVEKHNTTRLPKLTKVKIVEFLGAGAKDITIELIQKSLVVTEGGLGPKITTGHLKLTKGEESATIPFDGTDMEFGGDFSSPNQEAFDKMMRDRKSDAAGTVPKAQIIADNSQTAKQRADATNNQAALDFKYARAVRDGDAYLKQKNLVQSEKNYRAALEIRDYETYPVDQLEKLVPGFKAEWETAQADKKAKAQESAAETAEETTEVIETSTETETAETETAETETSETETSETETSAEVTDDETAKKK